MVCRNKNITESIYSIIATIGIMGVLFFIAFCSLFVVIPEMIYKSSRDLWFIHQNRY